MTVAIDRIPGLPVRVRRALEGIGSDFLPYVGAIKDVDIGSFDFTTTGSIKNAADNSKHYFGAADDAYIAFDGVDLLINARAVGTGNVLINSDLISVLDTYTLGESGHSWHDLYLGNSIVGDSGQILDVRGDPWTLDVGFTVTDVITANSFNATVEASGYAIAGSAVLHTGGGSGNTSVGKLAGDALTTGTWNTLVGWSAGTEITEGYDNVCVGVDTGPAITTGFRNVCIGKDTGKAITEGFSNVCIGFEAGLRITTGEFNLCLGTSAGEFITTAVRNICIGHRAGENNTVDGGVFVGFEAGMGNTTGVSNVALGYVSGAANQTGSYNLFIGSETGASLTATSRHVMIGYRAGYAVSTGYRDTLIGFESGRNLTTGYENVCIGDEAGHDCTEGNRNVIIGSKAGSKITTGDYNVCLGTGAVADWPNTIATIGIGAETLPTASNQLIIGSVTAPITAAYIGEGVVSATPQDLTLNATGGSGSDIAAGDLIIAGGKSTGDADPGDILFQTSTAGAAGTTLQTLTTRLTLTGTSADFSALNLVTTGTIGSGRITSSVSGIGSVSGNLIGIDTAALAAAVGGGVTFQGRYTAGSLTTSGYVKSSKVTAVSGEYNFNLLLSGRGISSNGLLTLGPAPTLVLTHSGAVDVATSLALQITNVYAGTGRPTSLMSGFNAQVQIQSGAAAGTLPTARAGAYAIVNNDADTIITSAIGIDITTPINAGTFTDTYGVYIKSQTVGTQTNTPYGVYQAGAADLNYFAGTIQAGDVNISNGTLSFAGTGGLIFAEIYAHSAAADITSALINDWDQITAFDIDGESNGATPDHTNDHITILTAGKYLVNFHWCGHGPNVVHDWDFHLSKNNNASQFNNLTAHVTTPTTQKDTSVSCTGIIDLAVDDTIELWAKRTSAGNDIVLTTDTCGITLTQIGGT